MKKVSKALLSWLLTICLLITPFSGVFVFATEADPGPGPLIEISIDAYEYVTVDTAITVTYSANGDTTVASCDTRLEGVSIGATETITFTPAEQALVGGSYTLVAEAVGSNGVTSYDVVTFIVCDEVDVGFTYAEDNSILPADPNATASTNYVEPLDYSMGYGATTDGNVALEDIKPYDAATTHGVQYLNKAVSSQSMAGIPYQSFDVALNGKTDGEVIVRYTGATKVGERIAVKVYNPATAAWDTIGTITGSGSVSEAVDVATYADNDAIHVMAVLDYVTNGSNTMIWSTDPQHYTKFEDLYAFYYEVYQYAADEYTAGNVGYIMTTGDLVDDIPSSSAANTQWGVADKAMQIIEAVGMPNGLVSGNHDVKTVKYTDFADDNNAKEPDYSKYLEHFGADRYNTEAWYGGSLNDNISHYDLVTIGNTDFIILYLGYGLEATDETIAWANEVLQTYSHRTAIVATHQYLEASTADHAVPSRADLIHETIVDPNPNVKMVVCGHDDGSIVNEVTASDGRVVYELLADYQFVEAENDSFYEEYYHAVDPDGEYKGHYIGSVSECCGDGYIRLLTVDGSVLSSVTYSPVTGKYNPFGDRENITIDLGTDAPDRELSTVAFSAYVLGEECTEELPENPTAIVITNGDSTTYHHTMYVSYPDAPEAGTNEPVDLAALNALIAKADALDTSAYTVESVEYFEIVLADAKSVDTTDSNDVSLAYYYLTRMIAMLEEPTETIDPSTLLSVYDHSMAVADWTASGSAMREVTSDDGMTGIQIKRAINTTVGWSSIYQTTDYAIKPNNGKIYLNLSVDADSSWCVYLVAEQAGTSINNLRVNFAIDNATDDIDCDSFNGVYNGVYDVTDAFLANGFDVNATINIKTLYLWVTPGENAVTFPNFETDTDTVTYYHVEFMTDMPSDEPVDTTELQALINSAAELDETLYTPSTWAKLTTAIAAANAFLADGNHVQADVNLEKIKLQKVMDSLKLLTDVVPEPEGSLLPADEGEWVPNIDAMEIYRNEDNYTVIQNTNGQWPNATYTLPEPMDVTVADHQLSIDVKVATQANIYLLTASGNILLNSLITTNIDAGSGDMKAGEYKLNLPLFEIPQLADLETVTIKGVQVWSMGAAGESSAVTIRQLQITDYVAPPHVEDVQLDMIPESADGLTLVAGDGTVTVENGIVTIVNNADGDLRVTLDTKAPFDLTALNALHMQFNTDMPFKMAYYLKSSNETGGAQWLNTSGNYANIFTIDTTADRAAAGEYDVNLEIRDLAGGITDKTSVYYDQFIILLTGKGTFTLNVAEMVEYDGFVWDEDMTTYGEAATPDNPYFQHAAKEAPKVAEKYDLLKKLGLSKHPSVTAWTMYGNQGDSSKWLGIEVDLNKTPYLYYSVAVPADGNFTFSLYGDQTNTPWLSFLDESLGGAKLNMGAANWDSYGEGRQQYAWTSVTGCIDMRQYTVNNSTSWNIRQINFYNSTGKEAIISYFFFGSEPIEDAPVYEKGDVNMDGEITLLDALNLFQHLNGQIVLSEEALVYAEVAKPADEISLSDALRLFQYMNGQIDSLE